MLKKLVSFKNFQKKFLNVKEKNKVLNVLLEILSDITEIIKSFSIDYKNSYKKDLLIKLKKKFSNFKIIGMGGSILGTQAIYDFLKHKIKKTFFFIDNLQNQKKNDEKKYANIIVSKSGNTIETIINSNIHLKKNNQNIFITENNKSYLQILAQKLKSEIVCHNNFIGGRYSVLSEVGMLPAELMGLNVNNFKQLNSLVNDKFFFNSLINNVASTFFFIKKKKFNSIIINYDERSNNLFNWYQLLIAESFGKKLKGILPVISTMPKDNNIFMQCYIDCTQNNFFTFFYVHDTNSKKIDNTTVLPSHGFIKNKSISEITHAQKKATEKIFTKKNIPFRSFEIKRRDEKTLGFLFCFFILETILLGKLLNINPFDQPAVELIKKETKKILA